jgi:hypothetical protein
MRGWRGRQPQSPLLDGKNPPAPAAAEDGPGGKAPEKAEAGSGETADRFRGIGLPGRLQGHGPHEPIRRDPEDGLQHVHGPDRSRVHGKMVRLFLSEHHLAINAEERATMALTYLALTADEKADEKERALVLASLFRPTADGIVKDDAAPDLAPGAILSKILAR